MSFLVRGDNTVGSISPLLTHCLHNPKDSSDRDRPFILFCGLKLSLTALPFLMLLAEASLHITLDYLFNDITLQKDNWHLGK